MQWSLEMEKLDNEVAKIVREEKAPEKLQAIFPTAEELVEFSNRIYPYPYRRNSVLALAIQSDDSEVLGKILQMYFDKDDVSNDILALNFVVGTDSCGQYFDYHYFAEDMSPEAKARAEQFQSEDDEEFEMWNFKIHHDLLPEDKRTSEQKERVLMYEMIKNTTAKILEKDRFGIDRPPRILARDSEGVVMKEIFDDKEEFVLLREQQAFSEIRLNDNKNKLNDDVIKLKIFNQRNFAQQAFKNLFFPELYYWAREPLNKMQKVLQTREAGLKNKDLEDFFTISNGVFEIAREYDFAAQTLKMDGKTFAGVCRYSAVKNESIIVIPANKIKDLNETQLVVVLNHEMTHNLDLVDTFSQDKGNERISDCDAIKFTFMALCMEMENYSEEIQDIPEHLQTYYKTYSHTKEFVAKLMENNDFSGCKLLQNAEKLIKRYNVAKIDEDGDFLGKMKNAMKQRMPDYEQARQTYGKFVLWFRSEEQCYEMAEEGKPEEYLNVQQQKIEFRKKDFYYHYQDNFMKKNQLRFDERMALLLGQFLNEEKQQPAFEAFRYPLDGKNR